MFALRILLLFAILWLQSCSSTPSEGLLAPPKAIVGGTLIDGTGRPPIPDALVVVELGKIVICDRFADSTVVYQGHARGFDVAQLRDWNEFATGGLKPDLTLLLDLPASQGIARLENKDRLDNEPIEFHEKVRQGFLIEASIAPDRWTQVDASQNPGTVLEDCIKAMSALLEKRIIKAVGTI